MKKLISYTLLLKLLFSDFDEFTIRYQTQSPRCRKLKSYSFKNLLLKYLSDTHIIVLILYL